MSIQFNDLNEAQRQAVQYNGGHLLIVAGPGTGKTHTLVRRISVLTEQLTFQEKILAITFTQKAAEEMHARLQEFESSSKYFVGTFHQFAVSILREYGKLIGLDPNFQIANEKNIKEAAALLWPSLSSSEKKRQLEDISFGKAANFTSFPPEEVLRYNSQLRAQNLLDYDDLLLLTWQLFKDHADVLTRIQKQYRYVFVDEYQDINPIQHAILKQLVSGKVFLTAIGDPNQSIYGFRGSNVSFFHQFANDFPNAHEQSLKNNYRSTENILKASSKMLSCSSQAVVPELTANIYKEGRLVIHPCATQKAEAEYVVHTIEKLVGGTSLFSHDTKRVSSVSDETIAFDDIVVLYRLHSQAEHLAESFERSGIPYHIVGRKTDDDIAPQKIEEPEFVCAKVHLMTMHAAKGLEFDTVFVVGSEDGLSPLKIEKMMGDIEEERRLFYVAMTRAKRNLYFTFCQKRQMYGKTYQPSMSPFVKAIEAELKKEQALPKKHKTEKQLTLFK